MIPSTNEMNSLLLSNIFNQNHSEEQRPSREASRSYARQEIPSMLWTHGDSLLLHAALLSNADHNLNFLWGVGVGLNPYSAWACVLTV